MCGLMKELGLTIPKWYLTRYMKICVSDIGNRNDQRKLCVSGVDIDGTGFTLFKSVVLRNNGQRIRKIINNKENRDDENNYDNNDFFKKYEVDKTIGLTVELEFYGHYEE